MNQEELNELLRVLEIQDDVSDVSVRDVKKAFRRLAILLHPDKSGEDKTAAFQRLRAAYEKLKQFLEVNGSTKDEVVNVTEKDEDKFFDDNFEQFNFPHENKGSFTVRIEDHLADAWQENIENILGEPKLKINSHGTECDRSWKIAYAGIEITLHIYNNPKNKKGSKLMIQGSKQSLMCS